MKKLKWKHDKKNNQWYTMETSAWANDGFTINKVSGTYFRLLHGNRWVHSFNLLRSAKQVAELIANG